MKPLLNGETTFDGSPLSSGSRSSLKSALSRSPWLSAPSKREWILIFASIVTGLVYLHASRGWFTESLVNPVMGWDVDHGITLGKGEGHRWHEGIGPLELERERVIEDETFEYEEIVKDGVYVETELVQHAPGGYKGLFLLLEG
jgi:hypothetical protein